MTQYPNPSGGPLQTPPAWRPVPPHAAGPGPWSPAPPASPARRGRLGGLPVAHLVGLILCVATFWLHGSLQTEQIANGKYSCSYVDYGAYIGATGIGICLVIGAITWLCRPTARRLPGPVMAAVSLLLLAFIVLHVSRGNGLILSPCR